MSGQSIIKNNRKIFVELTESAISLIKGTIPAQQSSSILNQLVPFGSGVLNTLTTNDDFYYAPAIKALFLGNLYSVAAYPYAVGDLNIQKSGTNATNIINQINTGVSANSFNGIFQAESNIKYSVMARYNASLSGNYTSTSVASANTFQLGNTLTGADGTGSIVITPLILYTLTGTATTNVATRVDVTGFRVGLMSDIHTANLNGLTIGTNSYFGGNSTAGAKITIAAGAATANTAPLKFTSGTNLTTAVAGVMEYNGTNLFFTRTGTTRQSVLTANVVTTEVAVSDTTVTININGTDYKLLAKA